MGNSRKLLKDLYELFLSKSDDKEAALKKLKSMASQLVYDGDIEQDELDAFVDYVDVSSDIDVGNILKKWKDFEKDDDYVSPTQRFGGCDIGSSYRTPSC